MGKGIKATGAAATMIAAAVGAIGLHLFATYIAYHDGVVSALITFFTPPLSDIFWFGVAWHATGTPFSLYGASFIAILVAYGLANLLGKESSP